jgi:hypothetical protein
MKKSTLITILSIIIATIAISVYLTIRYSPKNREDILLKEIESLETKLDSLSNKKDSIKTVIVNTDKEIISNEKHYQTTVNNIIMQSDSSLSESNRQYIIEYAASRGINIR